MRKPPGWDALSRFAQLPEAIGEATSGLSGLSLQAVRKFVDRHDREQLCQNAASPRTRVLYSNCFTQLQLSGLMPLDHLTCSARTPNTVPPCIRTLRGFLRMALDREKPAC